MDPVNRGLRRLRLGEGGVLLTAVRHREHAAERKLKSSHRNTHARRFSRCHWPLGSGGSLSLLPLPPIPSRLREAMRATIPPATAAANRVVLERENCF